MTHWFQQNFNLLCTITGCGVLGIASGALGCFTLLRRQSLLGDALSHAALPGVCIAFILTGSKASGILLAGALVSGLTGALFILWIVRGSRIKEDSAIGIILSVFFGCGYVLLTWIKTSNNSNQAGLDTFLFGRAASIVPRDILVLSLLTLVVLLVLALLYKELKLLAFDRDFGVTQGFPMRVLEVILTALIVVGVVIGLQTVGVILMAAMLVTPAAAARQWTHSLTVMILLSSTIGAVSGVSGSMISYSFEVPTGPVIVLTASAILVISLAISPRQGLVWAFIRVRSYRRKVQQENLLADLYRLGETSHEWVRGYSQNHLASIRALPPSQVSHTLDRLVQSGWVHSSDGRWSLTDSGQNEARRVVRHHRLWELYLSRRLELAPDHVHRDAEEMEHALPPSVIQELESMIDDQTVDPHGQAIPPLR